MQQTMQPQQTQQQPQMMTPPRVVTTKDYLYLKDALSWELLAAKKSYHFANECSCQQTKQLLNKAGQMHQRHYNILLKHLQTNNNEEMKKVPQPQQ